MSKSKSEVACEIEGQKYTGHFRVDNKGILHVSYGGYSKSTQLGGHAKYPKAAGGNTTARISGPGAPRALILNASENTKATPAFTVGGLRFDNYATQM